MTAPRHGHPHHSGHRWGHDRHHHQGAHWSGVRPRGSWGYGGWGIGFGLGYNIGSLVGHIIQDVTRANDYYGYYGPTAHGHPRAVAYAPEAEWLMPPMAGGHRGLGGLFDGIGSLFHGTGVAYAPEAAMMRPERPEEREARHNRARHQAREEGYRSRANDIVGVHPGDEQAWLKAPEVARVEAALRAADRKPRRERS